MLASSGEESYSEAEVGETGTGTAAAAEEEATGATEEEEGGGDAAVFDPDCCCRARAMGRCISLRDKYTTHEMT